MKIGYARIAVAISLASAVIVGFSSYTTARLATITTNYLLESKDAQIGLEQAKIKRFNQELASAKKELETATHELSTKLKELSDAQKKIKSQEAQISANANELSRLRSRPPLFSFKVDATSLTDSATKQKNIQEIVTTAYDVVSDLYGLPYLLHSVTINLVDSLSNPNAGAETEIKNGPDGLSLTIRLTDFDRNSFNDVNGVIHEIIHTFHGLAVLSPVAYEEGITVAATDIVMEKLIARGKIPSFSPLYIRISASEYANSSLRIPSSDTAFYSSADASEFYQLEGYGWRELYRSNSNFFRDFNEKIYTKKRSGIEITDSLVRATIAEVVTKVSGQSVNEWLNTKAFTLD